MIKHCIHEQMEVTQKGPLEHREVLEISNKVTSSI